MKEFSLPYFFISSTIIYVIVVYVSCNDKLAV